MSLVCLIPAAGASARMRGRDKLLEEIDGAPLLTRQTRAVLSLGLPVLVTLPASAENRMAALRPVRDAQLTLMNIANAHEGLSASIRMGASWATAQAASALMVALPDLPDLTADDFKAVKACHAAHPEAIIRATSANGDAGHPTVIPARLFEKLTRITGDQGAKAIMTDETPVSCPLPGARATTDLDTPEAWQEWRATRDAQT